MKRPRVVLADDHTLVLEGIRALLAHHAELVGTAADGRALVQAAMRLKPDIVLLDISMPVLNGIEAARRLRRDLPGAKLIFVTQYCDALYVDEARSMGASGYVLKSSAATELVRAIEASQRGQTYFSPLLGRSAKEPLRGEAAACGKLTTREREVLQLVSEGRSAKEIATALRITPKTVQFHKINLTRKLGIRTTAELVKYALRHGMTPP